MCLLFMLLVSRVENNSTVCSSFQKWVLNNNYILIITLYPPP